MTNEELTALALSAGAGIPHENIHASAAIVTRLQGRERAAAAKVYATLIAEKKLAREPVKPLVKPKEVKSDRAAMDRAWRARREIEARRDMEEST
jgi:hypothetical protein